MLVVGRVCMPYVVRSVEKRSGQAGAEMLKTRLWIQVSMKVLSLYSASSFIVNLDDSDSGSHDHHFQLSPESAG